MSLGITKGGTVQCGVARCKTCCIVPHSPVSKIVINGNAISLPSGNCKSKNIIYLSQCNLCPSNFYVGRTVQPLNKRINGHRQSFSSIVKGGLKFVNDNDTDDSFCLGLHLYNDHGITGDLTTVIRSMCCNMLVPHKWRNVNICGFIN